MLRTEAITKDWKEAGSFPAQINLFGFWDEHAFLTKSGDLGAMLRIGGIDYESLDHAGRDYAVKRLEAALRSLDDRCRLYQILFKHNQPTIPHEEYENPLIHAAVEQRAAFLRSKADRLYSIEIYWVVMVDGSYAKTGLLHALSQLLKQPRTSLRDLRALFSSGKERTLIYEQIERDRLRLQQKINSFCPPKELYDGKPYAADPRGRVLPPFDELIESGRVVGLNFPVALNPALSKTIGTLMKVDYQRAVLLRIPKMDVEPHRHFRPTAFICDEYQLFASVGADNPNGDERFWSLSRQPKCIPVVATQSTSSLKDALPNEGVKTLLQAFRSKVFLSTSDPDTARFASEICGKADRTRISYTVSESSNNANVGWLSGRTSSSKGSVSASKQYQRHREPLFEEKAFFELKNAQAIVAAFDGVSPLPPTYCYLKPDFLPANMTWFEQERIGFDPERVRV